MACAHLLTLTSNPSLPRLPATTVGISMSGIGDKREGGRQPLSLTCVFRLSLVVLSMCAQLADSPASVHACSPEVSVRELCERATGEGDSPHRLQVHISRESLSP